MQLSQVLHGGGSLRQQTRSSRRKATRLVSGFEALTARYGAESIHEAANANPGERSTKVLDDCIEAAEMPKIILHAPVAVDAMRLHRSPLDSPWQLAMGAARDLRHRLALPLGPIRNTRLGEILGINVDHLRTRHHTSFDIPCAVRLRQDTDSGSKLALRRGWSHYRRFDLSRSLGDIIWSSDDALGPLSDAKSERQKFQRAFAQGFLCPFPDLQAYIDTNHPVDDDIHTAARHFHVSERMIQATLYNNGVLDWASFEQMVDAS